MRSTLIPILLASTAAFAQPYTQEGIDARKAAEARRSQIWAAQCPAIEARIAKETTLQGWALAMTLEMAYECPSQPGQHPALTPEYRTKLVLAVEAQWQAAAPSMLLRVGAVAGCLHLPEGELEQYLAWQRHEIPGQDRTAKYFNAGFVETLKPIQLADWTVCRNDARHLDLAAAKREIATLPATLISPTGAAALTAWITTVIAYANEYDAMMSQIAGLGDVFAAADKGAAKWLARARTERDVFAAAYAVNDAVSTAGDSRSAQAKALAGCDAKLRTLLHKRIGAAKGIDGVRAALSDGANRNLVNALVGCDLNGGNSFLAEAQAKVMNGALVPVVPGPRIAGFLDAASELARLAADHTQFPIKPHEFISELATAYFDNFAGVAIAQGHGQGGWSTMKHEVEPTHQGVIQAVKRDKAGVTVTFRTKSWQQPNNVCTETHHVVGFTRTGRGTYDLDYEQICHQEGTVTVAETPPPILVPVEVATGLAPGQWLRSFTDASPGGPLLGFPIEAYQDTTHKKLVIAFGMRL